MHVVQGQPSGAASSASRRDVRGFLLRLGASICVLAYVLWRIDLRALLSTISRLSPWWALATFAVIYAAIAVSAWKWGVILSGRGRSEHFGSLFRLYMIGQFFNNVLPTTIGGDVVRAWEHSKRSGSVAVSAGSVLSERLIAGVAQGVATVLALAFVRVTPLLLGLAFGFLALDVAFAALFAVPRVAEALVRSVLGRRMNDAASAVVDTVEEVRATLRDPGLVARAGALSLVFQVCVALVVVCIFGALGHPFGVADSVVLTPMVFTVTPLPISIGGFGVREAAYVYFFGQAGITATTAVAASFLFFAFVGIASLPGAPLYALAERERRRA